MMTIINLLQTGENGKETPKISITFGQSALKLPNFREISFRCRNFLATKKHLVFFSPKTKYPYQVKYMRNKVLMRSIPFYALLASCCACVAK